MTDTLKSICEQCAHLRDPQLEFIPQESQREKQIILRDLRELVAAATAEQEKSVALLAGSLFESVLYSFIQGQEQYIVARGGVAFNPKHILASFVNTFNAHFSNLLMIPDIIVGHRNVIHINRELQSGDGSCARAARDLMTQLDALLGALEVYARS